MRRLLALSLVTLGACVRPPSNAAPPSSPATILIPPHPEAPAEARPVNVTRVVADRLLSTFHLGTALFVAFVAEEQPPNVRLARVDDDGSLREVAQGMPPSNETTTRGGSTTLSGTPSALFGEPEGPIWMAFTHYSVFGDAVVYRADTDRWRCVGRCPTRPDPERWGGLLEARMPNGERTPTGDLVGRRSRGHLLRVENRVSGEGESYVFPRVSKASASTAVEKMRKLAHESPVELADGSIVDLATQVPEVSIVYDADGHRADDFWLIDHAGLVHVRGAAHERSALPDKSVSSIHAAADGSLWLSGGAVAYRRDRDEWRSVPLGGGPSTIVGARRDVLFVVREERLLRIALQRS